MSVEIEAQRRFEYLTHEHDRLVVNGVDDTSEDESGVSEAWRLGEYIIRRLEAYRVLGVTHG